MNFTTTSMSAPRIWGFNRQDTEMRTALAAGWGRSDLVWERLMEQANALWKDGQNARATRLFKGADILARLVFPAGDMRLAASAANLSIIAHANGATAKAEALQRRALDIWSKSSTAIGAMDIKPRSRSSLFHLRMEALHRTTYHDNMRIRIGRIADETLETLRVLTSTNGGAGHRHYARWRGERPTVFDDTRKVLSACLLIIDT